jgi:hypothetical protein
MRHLLAFFRCAVRPALLCTFAALAGCAGPLRTTPPTDVAATAPALAATPAPGPGQIVPAAPTAAPPDCNPSTIRPEPGEPIMLLSRVVGCPGLVRVEWRGAELLVPAALLGLSERDLGGLPEEVRGWR